MPAANERALEKAKTIPADAIIFDLEDAVAFWSKKFEALKNDRAAARRKRGIQERVVSAGWLLSTEYMRARQIVRPARRLERRLCRTCFGSRV